MFAKAGTNREQSGATYYGIMEMSANQWERVITVGNPQGRAFTGKHGDGVLDASGSNDVDFWPGFDAVGAAWRGGSFGNPTKEIYQISNRKWGSSGDPNDANRNLYYGGRGVRTAP